ncbi:DNA polymerase-3 subunit gamma/tau [Psychromicrobium silvestre]|uniref:DNA-directed DNA polymerase n=1 Tax=Psychromicrobium silvestre TaxID=1645614 RepID=A0A7Y9S8Q0_9MICC|nr:DNA polymerase-3 subunit gamma/tau [Psychromicrobium silvestre]
MTTALYRRYRPDTFADVIGQEHVTEPLMTALRKNRVNHAYLFSGPRGCGKTTSARILARCLNCAQGPTDTPCGTCDSCVGLARGGSGSLDVIEIDAASHGGVDDARDLRERATFAPVRDRYKIFIIDEAHMVTSAGFNALLKIVEEPPEHIKFIFATTEPDKVIGTIRSRTHHYPFRLVPPEPLMAYLNLLCEQENVPVAPGVLSLVVRAGGGSVRDSLSVLDQLMAGAGERGLDYELAVSLLGYTHASLLDDVVDALAASDAGTVFRAVDRVVQTGLDPRRFVEDLLERFRDLIIVQAMPESARAILRGMPEDQIARMQTQSTQLGRAELSRAADVTNNALTEMTGATSPRLHLELLCARLLLPGADQSERGITARVDRIERRLSYAAPAADNAAVPSIEAPAPVIQERPSDPSVAERQPAASEVSPSAPSPAVATPNTPVDDGWGLPENPQPASTPIREPERAPEPAPSSAPDTIPGPSQAPAPSSAADPTSQSASQPASRATSQPSSEAADGIDMLRRAWPDVLDQLTKIKRSSWALIAPNAVPQSFNGQELQLTFSTEGLAMAFTRGEHSVNLRAAIKATLGIDCQISAGSGNIALTEFSPQSSGSAAPNPKDLTEPEEPVREEAPPFEDPPEPENPREQVWQRPVQEPQRQHAPAVEDRTQTAPAPSTFRPTAPPVAEPGWGDLGQAPDWISGSGQPDSSQESPAQQPDSQEPSQEESPRQSATQAGAELQSSAKEPGDGNGPSLYQRLRQQAQAAEPEEPEAPTAYVEDIPSADDETIEESGLVGRAAVERILGGRLIEERPLNRP